MNERKRPGIKKFCLAFAVLVLACSSTYAAKPEVSDANSTLADFPELPRTYGRSKLWSVETVSEFFFSGGLSYFFPQKTVLGYKLAVDYQITKRWGVGVHAANYHHYFPLAQARTPLVGARGMFTILSPGKRPGRKNAHLYLGVAADLIFGEYGDSVGELSVKADPLVGFRYRISEQWFLWTEGSYRTASIGVSFEY